MYPEERIKDGRGYRLPFGWLCSVTILNLVFSRLGFLPGNPIGGGQSETGKLWAQGWYEGDGTTERREYHVVQVDGKPLQKRVLIATCGHSPSSIRRDGGGTNWDSKSAFLRSCVVTLSQIANSVLPQNKHIIAFTAMEFGEEVVVGRKKVYRGVDSLLTLQHAVFTDIKDHRYIDILSQKLCKKVAKAEVGENAIFFAPCRDAFAHDKRKSRMLEGDSRGKTRELKNEYWTTLRPFKRLLRDTGNNNQQKREIQVNLFNAVMDLRRPLYLCYYDSETAVLGGTEEKKYFLLHPDFAKYLVKSDVPITRT